MAVFNKEIKRISFGDFTEEPCPRLIASLRYPAVTKFISSSFFNEHDKAIHDRQCIHVTTCANGHWHQLKDLPNQFDFSEEVLLMIRKSISIGYLTHQVDIAINREIQRLSREMPNSFEVYKGGVFEPLTCRTYSTAFKLLVHGGRLKFGDMEPIHTHTYLSKWASDFAGDGVIA